MVTGVSVCSASFNNAASTAILREPSIARSIINFHAMGSFSAAERRQSEQTHDEPRSGERFFRRYAAHRQETLPTAFNRGTLCRRSAASLRNGQRYESGTVLAASLLLQHAECDFLTRLQIFFNSPEILDVLDVVTLVGAGDHTSDDGSTRDTGVLCRAVCVHSRNVHTVLRRQTQLTNHIRSDVLDTYAEPRRRSFTLVIS